MSVATQVKAASSMVLGVAILVGMLAIGFGLLTGAAAFSMWVVKWTYPAFLILLLISILVLAPLSLIPPTRGFSAMGFMIASLALGAILWLWGMGYAYSSWGLFGLIVGLGLFGVGVIPVAMFAALVHGDWGNLGLFIVTGALTVGFRALANWLGQKAEERKARLNNSRIFV